MAKSYGGITQIKKAFASTQKLKKIYAGATNLVYSASHIVTYHVNTDDIRTVEIDDGADAIAGAPNVSSKFGGWAFVGWRDNSAANPSVHRTKIITTDGVHLYAVYTQTITLSYNANGGSSTPASQSGARYFNNGNVVNPSFKLAGAIARGNSVDASGNEYSHAFSTWNIGNAGATITLGASTTAIAQWSSTWIRRWFVKAGQIMSGVSLLVTGRDNAAIYPSSGSGSVTATLTYNHDTLKFNVQPANAYPNRTFYLRTSYGSGTYNGMYYGPCSPWGTGYPSFGSLNAISNNGGTISFAANGFTSGWYLAITAGIGGGASANCYIHDLYVQ